MPTTQPARPSPLGLVGLVAVAFLVTACSGTAVPDVAGQELAFARGALESAGLDYEVEYETTDEVVPGTVVRVEERDDEIVIVVAERPTRTLTGTFTLIDSGVVGDSTYCFGTGGYDDVRGGMKVTVRDGSGTIIATGDTDDGRTESSVICVLEFSLSDVPIVDFYEIEVGRRGSISYSYDELDEVDFDVAFTLS